MIRNEADVVVVGAGPAGSATAYHLARRGLQVALLERSRFPRPKVCGDGLTPRAVRLLEAMGVETTGPGWRRNAGVRFTDGPTGVVVPWPARAGHPAYGLTRTRDDLDGLLVERAVAAGADLRTATRVTAPLLDPAGARVVGVVATTDGRPAEFRAPVVVLASGTSARLPAATGVSRRPARPVGVAVRRYFRAPSGHDGRHLDIVLGLRGLTGDGSPFPGYGWIFPMGDGRVNVGLALHDAGGRLRRSDHRALLGRWLRSAPEWGLTDESDADGPASGGALPMGQCRGPHYAAGVLLVGDAGGMVNPFTGEGIAYAMESGELAAGVLAEALTEPPGPARERCLRSYAATLGGRHDAYHWLGSRFVDLVDDPRALRLGLRLLLPRPRAMAGLLRGVTAGGPRPPAPAARTGSADPEAHPT
jgi:geranylgeranyl reductase family protein